ncbi:siroheme synthase [Desulforamulus profundi]|uniref:precorrin-2 dehydrogenase n=1 Tax=Desulforamulus profundi TaxID=1383067 RepID=A0A2C6MHL1_9FIRM|nr:bifunctional precorrin-2 dehydrogenase/sirohydrochlorin ferrochelatase [Desulforamulus profundi]MCL4440257.1 bifunctional precorrin-2 dehydrogenase/sirohydrochlorin ferrochelatase [Bacillota bacterium]MCL5780080.1 bifunctional precorrin-2 dehydrogenase/sirohydrochlorin ferrochelatase [Bacillota bacterium]PHJ39234.1 siroheme synthase [Desulforamulus profundi]
MENLYPIYLKLAGQLCLVVGGGKVAERKVGSLLECGARVRLVSPAVTSQIEEWANQGKLELRQRQYQTGDLEGAFLVFAATNQEKVNRRVSEECLSRNLAVNVVDDPPRCNFFVPSVIRRGKLSIAISTSGASPALAAKIRRQLERQFGPEYEEFMEILADLRRQVLAGEADIQQRKQIFSHLVESDILDLLRKKKYDQVKERIQNAYRGNRS